MKRVIANVTLYPDKVPNLQELLPKEQAVTSIWKEQGILEHYFFKDDKNGVVLVFKDIDSAGAKELMTTAPLAPYFYNVAYLEVEKHY